MVYCSQNLAKLREKKLVFPGEHLILVPGIPSPSANWQRKMEPPSAWWRGRIPKWSTALTTIPTLENILKKLKCPECKLETDKLLNARRLQRTMSLPFWGAWTQTWVDRWIKTNSQSLSNGNANAVMSSVCGGNQGHRCLAPRTWQAGHFTRTGFAGAAPRACAVCLRFLGAIAGL